MSLSRRSFLEALAWLAGGLVAAPAAVREAVSVPAAVAVPEVPVTPDCPLGYVFLNDRRYPVVDLSIEERQEVIDTISLDPWTGEYREGRINGLRSWNVSLEVSAWSDDAREHLDDLFRRYDPVDFRVLPYAPEGTVFHGQAYVVDAKMAWLGRSVTLRLSGTGPLSASVA